MGRPNFFAKGGGKFFLGAPRIGRVNRNLEADTKGEVLPKPQQITDSLSDAIYGTFLHASGLDKRLLAVAANGCVFIPAGGWDRETRTASLALEMNEVNVFQIKTKASSFCHCL